ncbi:hypothetical protein [Legionella shakespearei]|uniref:Uncharacterized protein n=1 Tax=Legionella shakespearei DSM 23087 TaxID=1122169 RepID=A0A0W0YLD2_9GAMM|nr:hypothetical protein [Legionella shakespearei]KTD57704.1 hypothetical protein Lsha_2545 [Legionella shakespearei DSM 23087]
MTTENNGLDETNSNSKKNEKNPMMQLLESLQPMVDEINEMGVNAIKDTVGSFADAFLSPMPDSSDTSSMLGNAQMPSTADSVSAESTETAALESAEILAL